MRAFALVGPLLVVSLGCPSAECGDGFREIDGQCFDPKAECEIACEEHEVCDITTTPNTCNCADGYTRSAGLCVWEGVVADPSFQGALVDGEQAWIEEGGGELAPTADNVSLGGDGGEVFLSQAASCRAGQVRQVLQMPSYASAGPLVAEVVYIAELVRGVAVGFGDAWTRLPPTDGQYETATFCLGEAAYFRPDPEEPVPLPTPLGGRVDLQISASERLDNVCGLQGGPVAQIRVDRLTIRPPRDGEAPCPAPAAPPTLTGVINAGAEPDDGGWTFDCEPNETCSIGGFRAAPEESGHLTVVGISREAGRDEVHRMSTRVSVPLPTNGLSPALAFWWRGTADQLFPARIGTIAPLAPLGNPERARPLETLIGTGGGRDFAYCLPPWTHGAVVDLAFELPESADDEAVELLVDDVRVTSDEDCEVVDGVGDPGFESAPNRWIGSSINTGDQRVVMQSEASFARSGDGALELSYGASGGSLDSGAQPLVETYVKVPAPDEEGGPAVAFYAEASVPPEAGLTWRLGPRCASLPGGACGCVGEIDGSIQSWQRVEVCLPASWRGRWYRLEVGMVPPVSTGETPMQERYRVRLDDFETLTTSACDCP